MFNKGLIKKLAAVVMSAVTLFSVSGLSSAYVSAADTNHFKFADIDLVVDVPKELICFTRTTTNNNSYLEKLGVDEATVLTNNMIANKIYLEAVPEVVIYGNTASNSLSNLNELDEDSLDSLYKEYVASQSSINNDNIKEELLNSSIVTINDIPYFVTDVYSLSNDVTVYTRKYYTVVRGYIYTYAIQSKTDKVSDDMNNNLVSIINSAKYQKVKNSPLQNAVFTETLSNIITVGVPILILLVILLVITKVGPKGRAKRVNEEARLREEYKRTHNK